MCFGTLQKTGLERVENLFCLRKLINIKNNDNSWQIFLEYKREDRGTAFCSGVSFVERRQGYGSYVSDISLWLACPLRFLALYQLFFFIILIV